jgi:hypothetical protein
MATKDKINALCNKQMILRMVNKWPEDIPYEQALYHRYVLKEVMEGLKEVEDGRGTDHDDFFDELERLCDEEENQAHMVDE